MPDEPVKCTVYLPPSLHERCKALADADGRKLSAWIMRQLSAVVSEADCAKARGGMPDGLPLMNYPTREEKLHS